MLEPCVVANRQGQVQVLVAVVEGFIPPTDRLECLALHQEAEPAQYAHVVNVRHAPVERHLLVAHHAVGRGTAGQEPTALAGRDHAVEPIAVHGEGVVIQEQNPRSAAFTCESVVPAGKIKVVGRPLDGASESEVSGTKAITPPLCIGIKTLHGSIVSISRFIASVVEQVQGVGDARRVLHQMRQKPRRDLAGVVRQHAYVNLRLQPMASIGCSGVHSVVSGPCVRIRIGMGVAHCSILSPCAMY